MREKCRALAREAARALEGDDDEAMTRSPSPVRVRTPLNTKFFANHDRPQTAKVVLKTVGQDEVPTKAEVESQAKVPARHKYAVTLNQQVQSNYLKVFLGVTSPASDTHADLVSVITQQQSTSLVRYLDLILVIKCRAGNTIFYVH